MASAGFTPPRQPQPQAYAKVEPEAPKQKKKIILNRHDITEIEKEKE